MPRPPGRRAGKIVVPLGVALVAVAIAIAWNHAAILDHLPAFDAEWVHREVSAFGVFGPLALVGLMILAIVISPIPSGPIAMAAGALYGAAAGAILSVIGAEIGALIAFCAARYLGFDAVRRSENRILKFIAVPRSQPALMLIVFASRLVPFISFDAISYAAGLTNLSFPRFAIATALGIVPICTALAMMGAGISKGGGNMALIVILGGSITVVPIIVGLLRSRSMR